jgi:hypothetical protein
MRNSTIEDAGVFKNVAPYFVIAIFRRRENRPGACTRACFEGWSRLIKDAAVGCLVGETPTSATGTVALPETEHHMATFILKCSEGGVQH